MNRQELAAKYGVTPERIRDESLEFLQCEGYLDDGTECETFCAWLERRLRPRVKPEPFEPYQKGDEYPE